MDEKVKKNNQRLKRKKRIRGKVSGTSKRPRLSVYKSNKHLYAQVIDDMNGTTLAASSTVSKKVIDVLDENSEIVPADAVGEALADNMLKKGIQTIVFDRNGYAFHGKIKVLADKVREKGVVF